MPRNLSKRPSTCWASAPALSYNRVLQIGRTIACLARTEEIQPVHIVESMQYWWIGDSKNSLTKKFCGSNMFRSDLK
jgi:hypothetical protein